MSGAYYNENDAFAAQWLRNLIAAGEIPDGHVDERSIVDVRAEDLGGYTQLHFFAGIAGWPLALRLAGWPEDRPVWTGSVPCQPLSSAGQRKGHADERHLWPAFQSLIAERRPATVLGEQVASKDGREWLAGVRADLEDLGYAVGAADLCAAGVGAPHIRQRLWWVADAADGGRRTRVGQDDSGQPDAQGCGEDGVSGWPPGSLADESGHAIRCKGDCGLAAHCCGGNCCFNPNECTEDENGECWLLRRPSGLGDAASGGWRQGRQERPGGGQREPTDARPGPLHPGEIGGMDDASGQRHRHGQGLHARSRLQGRAAPIAVGAGPFDFWSAHDLVSCADGKSRRVEPGTFPLAHGVPARVGRLRAYGNAINPWNGAEFIQAFLAAEADVRAP